MRTNIKGTNITLTDAIKDYLNKRLSTLEKLLDPKDESVMMHVEVGKTTMHHLAGDFFRTELNLHMARKDLRAVSEMADLYSSIDEAKDEMMNELIEILDIEEEEKKKNEK